MTMKYIEMGLNTANISMLGNMLLSTQVNFYIPVQGGAIFLGLGFQKENKSKGIMFGKVVYVELSFFTKYFFKVFQFDSRLHSFDVNFICWGVFFF